jgi:xanthine dehydrogenase accessory factor
MDTWTFILKKIKTGVPVVLIVVVDVKGSSPGKPGFKMAVAGDGTLSGSIGGGVMEYKMVDMARYMMQEGNPYVTVKRQVHDPDAGEERSGLICAGEQTHVFVPLGKETLPVLEEITIAVDSGKGGQLQLGMDGLRFETGSGHAGGMSWVFKNHHDWHYSETTGVRPRLSIFGGGHISIPLSQVFVMLGFHVSVYDDRPDLPSMSGNTFAHEKHLIDYSHAGNYIEEGPHSYVIIMTVSHASDQQILQQMLPLSLKYLGMIGSKNKVQKLFSNLREKGCQDEWLNRVDAPMGLPINSRSIEEISISIAAKVIQIKNA